MNDFRKQYQSAVNAMPGISLKAADILGGGVYRRREVVRRRRFVSSCVAACGLLLLCGVGTVATTGYFKNIIRTTENGFTSGDAESMSRSALHTAEAAGEINAQEGQDTALLREDSSFAVEEIKIKFREYNSWEAFDKIETAIFARPSIPAGEITDFIIRVSEYRDDVSFVQYMADGKMVNVRATCYADSMAHGSSTVYGDAVTGESVYDTKQGFCYTLLYTGNEGEENFGVHGAIVINDYEIYADFWGYSKKEALEMLESMDLTVYLETAEGVKR